MNSLNKNVLIAMALQQSSAVVNISPMDDIEKFALFVNGIKVPGYKSFDDVIKNITLLKGYDLSPLFGVIDLFKNIKKTEPKGEVTTYHASIYNMRNLDLYFIKEFSAPCDEPDLEVLLTMDKIAELIKHLDPIEDVPVVALLEEALEKGHREIKIHNVPVDKYNAELGDFTNPNESDNCLEYIQCPLCASSTRFSIVTSSNIDWSDLGTSEAHGCIDYEKSAQCECKSCNYTNQVKAFMLPAYN